MSLRNAGVTTLQLRFSAPGRDDFDYPDPRSSTHRRPVTFGASLGICAIELNRALEINGQAGCVACGVKPGTRPNTTQTWQPTASGSFVHLALIR